MTTNMSKVFNGILKGTHNLSITTLVQLTFYWVGNYFIVRREHGANRLVSVGEFTPYIDIEIKAKVIKTGSHEVVLCDHVDGNFHFKTRRYVGNIITPHELTYQRHRSSIILVNPDMGTILTCRHKFPSEWVLDDHIRLYIIQSGFFAFHQVGHVQLDWPLITTLVERWCLETHIPHANW
ncbi:hypothetical protein AAG906_011298 [Vitis piasezkii]